MANGTTNGGGARQWYVDAFKTLGFPVVVVVFLLAQDAGYIPSNSRETLAIVREILKDTNKAVIAQGAGHDNLMAQMQALRQRQAALCLLLIELSKVTGQDAAIIREACIAEATREQQQHR